METNGPATMSMILDAMREDYRINDDDYKTLKQYCAWTIEYMREYTVNKRIAWHEIRNEQVNDNTYMNGDDE